MFDVAGEDIAGVSFQDGAGMLARAGPPPYDGAGRIPSGVYMNWRCRMAALAAALLTCLCLPTAPARGQAQADADLKRLLDAATDKSMGTEELQKALVAFYHSNGGTERARKAALALAALPSPLDRLDPERISAEDRKSLALSAVVAFTRAHNRAISALAFSPDGRRLASSGWDNTVQLWQLDAEEPKALATIDGSPSSVAFRAGGRELVTGSPESRVVVWDVSGPTPKLRFNLAGHKYRPFALQFSADGRMLASGSMDPVLRLWRFENDEPEIWAALANENNAPALGVSALSFSGDGMLLAAGSLLGKQTLRLWDRSGAFLAEKSLPAVKARIVQFSPVEPTLAFTGDDAVIRLWSVAGEEPKELKTLAGHKAEGQPPPILALAFTPEGATLFSAGQDRRLIRWDVAKGQKQREWPLPDEPRALAVAPDGRHVAIGNRAGTLFILRSVPAP
jgi:WD40 repeat protein